jgi:hypothetical protein
MDDETSVLVWQLNPRPAVIHRDGNCPALSGNRTRIPQRDESFTGPGTAGWLTFANARRIPQAKVCQRCM